MSLPSLQWAWFEAEPEHASDKAVLVALAWHSNSEGAHAEPCNERLQSMTQLGESTIRSCLRRLEEAGFIEKNGKGPKGTQSYRLLFDAGPRTHVPGPAAGPEMNSVNEKKEEEKENPPSPPNAGSERKPDDAQAVWSHYVEVMQPRSASCGDEEKKMIRDALRSASVEECCGAIDGCAASTFHMGDNPQRRKYNQLSKILKGRRASPHGAAMTTRERIDFFLDRLAESRNTGLGSGVASADHARIAQAKRDVLDGYEFPSDEQARAAAVRATSWLAERGIMVVQHADGRPRFENKT